MIRVNLLWIALIGVLFLINLSSCNRGINSQGIESNLSLDSKRDSTAYVQRGDSILLPLKYNTEELGDFGNSNSSLPSKNNGSLPSMVGSFSGSFSFDMIKDKKYLHFLDGKMLEDKKKEKILKKLKAQDIDTIQIIPADEAVEIYGQKAVHGVVILETKKDK